MESCFPPIASLSLRSKSGAKTQKKRHSTGDQSHNNVNHQQIEIMPKIEILQDLDLYYIRQIASSLKELDLEQKIDLEIKMREGSAKLLAACNDSKNSSKTIGFNSGHLPSHNTQILEAAKNLLTSNERMSAYMAELQRRKKNRETTEKSHKPKAKLSINEIRMPLMWRDTDHFKNKGDYRRFAVFCLVKIGTEIYDTTMLFPIDRNLTDISFNDAILFTNVGPDFELNLEVYAIMIESDLTIASTPRKIKNTIHSSISRTVGKRLAANLKDELNNTKIGPKFDLIASATLTLAEVSDLPHTHDLTISPAYNSVNITNKLPLFGHFCCRLALLPESMKSQLHQGNLKIYTKTQPIFDTFARLHAFRIEMWQNELLSHNEIAYKTIEITRDTKIKYKNDLEFVISVMEEGVICEYILKTDSVEESAKWMTMIKSCIKEHIQWSHVALSEPMKLAVPGNSKQYFYRTPRQGSLYDQVPIKESENRHANQVTVSEMFAVPNQLEKSPTLTEYRRSIKSTSSSSRRSSQSSGTISASSLSSINSKKSHWPFGNK